MVFFFFICSMEKLQVRFYISLTNRFHVAVHLFSNTSQMTLKCGKNKKVAHEAIADGVSLMIQIASS